MKRVIRASQELKTINEAVSHGRIKYMAHLTEEPKWGFIYGQLTKIAPYDDADYVWARIHRNGLVEYIERGKVAGRMQLWSYEEEDYENVDEYFDEVIDQIMLDLEEYNEKIEPRMMYN